MPFAALRRRTRRAAPAVALSLAVVAAGAGPSVDAAESEPPRIDAPRFRQVGVVHVPNNVGAAGLDNGPSYNSGWLIMNPASRRGYLVTEGGGQTNIQSFDLDTLRPRQRVVVPGLPIGGGQGSAGESGGLTEVGEVVHAVDPVAKRIYLPVALPPVVNALIGAFAGNGTKRQLAHVLVLDEEAFDRDPATAFGAFSLPAGPQKRLAAYHLYGMTVSHHHTAPGEPGRLLAVFASANSVSALPVVTQPAPAGIYDHTLVQWAPGRWPTGGPPPAVLPSPALPVADAGEKLLQACAQAPLMPVTTGDHAYIAAESFQWGLLATPDAVLLACQSAPQTGGVARVALDRTGGFSPDGTQFAPLSKGIGDAIADEAAGRLLVRSMGGGATWWTFEGAAMRYTGSIAAHAVDGRSMGAGIDPGTGRFYTLTGDTCAFQASGGRIPTRGGLKVTDARLDPVPAAENVVPELALPSRWAIRVDPVTRRVYVRRGYPLESLVNGYPECDPHKRVRVEPEQYYRVYEDRIPVAQQPGELDDSVLTTDTAEADGVTEASYLGAGSGFGARSLLIGGVDRVTSDALSRSRSLCGKDDRELLAGSVGKVELSQQSTLAEAAALDADARTQEALADPVSRCRPQAPVQQVGPRNTDELNRCQGDLDAREAAFDQALPKGTDENEDGCTDRDGENRYAARCMGTRSSAAPGFDDGRIVPRDGFEARADCDEAHEKATASAAGAVHWSHDPAGVRVARSSSEVTVTRKQGKGVTVRIDAIARGIEIPGVATIGVVRAEASSTSLGRPRGASTSYTRTFCDVEVQGVVVVSGCLGDEREQRTVVKRINEALGTRGTARLRNPDPALAKGTAHGYLAAVQRDRKELFNDRVVTRDRSLAVPALEIVLYQGDTSTSVGRQVTHLAGVQASTSYGIVCLNGRAKAGGCAADLDDAVALGDFPADDPGNGSVVTVTEQLPGAPSAVAALPRENVITRLLRAVPRAVAEALRLLFNNPRELGLLAALWALLYAPCYLGDRRRAVRAVAARRLASPGP